MRRLLPLAVLLVTAAGCDITAETTLTFDGVEVEERGDASLGVENGLLVVSGLTGSRSGGFTVVGTPARVDVVTEPISIPAGGRFGIEVEDADGHDLASIYNEATGDGLFDVTFAFADALDVSAVTVRYKLDGRTVLTIPRLPLTPNGRRRASQSAGSGSGDSGSVHVIRENGRYIVVSDSQGSGDARRGCAGFFLTELPVGVGTDYGDGLCTDWIEVEPLSEATMPAGRVAVTARGVGTFRVRDLAVSETEG